jgi:hypothetical protein
MMRSMSRYRTKGGTMTLSLMMRAMDTETTEARFGNRMMRKVTREDPRMLRKES